MKRVVYNALYYLDEKIKSPNTKIKGGVESYLKQSFVSLKSCKLSNPEVETCLVTNSALPKEYDELFRSNGIEVKVVDYDDFVMPDKFKWSYAFYKIKALEYMVNNSGAAYLLGLDTDTYVASSLEEFWKECDPDKPILYSLPITSSAQSRAQIGRDYKRLLKKDKVEYCLQYGGEFLGGSKKALQELCINLHRIYDAVVENDFFIDVDSGDEALLSMAAHTMSCLSAMPYIRRYWGRRKCYDVDSVWHFIPVWHLPAEKNYGFNVMFNRLRRGNSCEIRNAAKLFNLPMQKKYSISMIKYYVYNYVHRKII